MKKTLSKKKPSPDKKVAAVDDQTLKRRLILLWLGEDKFGPPDGITWQMFDTINDSTRLYELVAYIPSAQTWHELFALAAARPRKRRRLSKAQEC